jgi:hypothetical protein
MVTLRSGSSWSADACRCMMVSLKVTPYGDPCRRFDRGHGRERPEKIAHSRLIEAYPHKNLASISGRSGPRKKSQHLHKIRFGNCF